MRTKTTLILICAAAMLPFLPMRAVAVDTMPTPAMSPEHAAGKKAIEAKDWNAAVKALTAAAQRDARNADVQNLLGYAYRNAGKLDLAFQHYKRALQLDPRHIGTHEYIGEAYLMVNNLAKAEEHLAMLKRHCPGYCEEYDDLNKKISEYRARNR